MRLNFSELGSVISYIQVQPLLLKKIKSKQFKDGMLHIIRDMALSVKTKEVILDPDDVLRIKH